MTVLLNKAKQKKADCLKVFLGSIGFTPDDANSDTSRSIVIGEDVKELASAFADIIRESFRIGGPGTPISAILPKLQKLGPNNKDLFTEASRKLCCDSRQRCNKMSDVINGTVANSLLRL